MLHLGQAKEKKRQASALLIQCAFRKHLAKIRINAVYRAHYYKVFDEVEQIFLYKHKVKLHLDEKKPRFTRGYAIPAPRANGEKAPEDYNPGVEDTSGGVLVIVTSNLFPIGKWGEVSEATNGDHEQLRYLLTHEFIGKFRPENVHILKNPSTNEFKDVMKGLRSECKASGFLVVYMATHVVTVTKGEKENPKEIGYFAFNNSVWGKNAEIAESCISISAFCGMLNKVMCKRKTIILNYAHQPSPKAVLFPSSKILYPPNILLKAIADGAKCVVIGACAIGSKAREYLTHSEFHVQKHLQHENESSTLPSVAAGTGTGTGTGGGNTKQPPQPVSQNEVAVTQSGYWQKKKMLELRHNALLIELMKEWGCRPFTEITRSPKPVQPVATWGREDGDFKIALPNQQDVSDDVL